MDLTTVISIIGLAVTIIIAMIGDAGVLSFLQRADVRYMRSQTLRRETEFVQGITLVNRGIKFTQEIELKVQYDAVSIVDYQIDEDAFLEKPSIKCQKGDKEFFLSGKKLLPGKSSTIYISYTSVTGQEEIPKINGGFDNRIILEDLVGYKRPLSDTVAILLGLFVLFWMVLGAFL